MSTNPSPDVEIRRVREDDEPAILDLLVACLEWEPGERFGDFFRWKHTASPFGKSPGWVATHGETIVGFRTFLRWEFETGRETVRTVRAVDTATHEDYRGRGIFRRLTEQAVAELTDDGVSFIFNTPNANSLPGYLKMGWRTAGRLPVLFRPIALRSVPRLAQARVPADLWSSPSDAGVGAAQVLADVAPVDDLVASAPVTDGMRTRRTRAYLPWRYGYAPLGYRAVTGASGPSDGIAFFRLRRRGSASEVALGDVIVPGAAPAAGRDLLKRVRHVAAGADYVVRLAGDGAPATGFLPLPRRGPVLAYRPLATSDPGPPALLLSLGDVELF